MDPLRRRATISLIAGAAMGLSGCVLSDDGEGAPEPGDTDDEDDSTEPGDDAGNESDDEPSGNVTDGQDTDTDNTGERGDARARAIERATIDYGEVIGSVENWYGSGGSYVALDQEEALTEPGALQVELFDSTFATAGYDFEEPFDLGDRHLSTAVKVESPVGGQLEIRLRAPSDEERVISARRVPSDVTGWMRVDMGITRGVGGPDLSNVQQLRLHVAGSENTDVRYWIDDFRATENSGDSYAILAFYGARTPQYETAFPILEERGLQAAVAVPPTGIGSDGRMTLDQLRELQDAGWDICSLPTRGGILPELSRDEQRSVIEAEKERLEELGFETGARHFFAPHHRMNTDTIDIVQDVHETGFIYGGNSAGMPPTAPHTLPVINGEEYDSSRSVILRADKHDQLVTLGIEDIGGDDGISPESLEDQLDRLEDNDYAGGLNVITPSDLVNHLPPR